MTTPTPEQLDAAVAAFQDGYEQAEEYGVTDEDAKNGLIMALQSLGVEIADTPELAELKAERAEQRAAREAYEKERAAMTPAERKAHDEKMQIAMNAALSHVFDSNQLLNYLRAETMTTTPPAIYASPSPDSALENILTAEMLVDDAETWAIIRNGGHENDPFTRSLTHSPLAMLAGTALATIGIRLFPHSAAKTTALKVIVGAEGANLGANVRVLIMMGK